MISPIAFVDSVVLQVKLIPDPLECTPRDVFIAQPYNVPALLARYIGTSQVELFPIQVSAAIRYGPCRFGIWAMV